MKKILMIMLLTSLVAGLRAENFRMGGIASVELVEKSYDEIISKFEDQNNLFPGFFWEVIIKRFGFGNTYQVKFDRQVSGWEGIDNEWRLSWIGTFDFRYHLFRWFVLDPFLEGAFGCAGGLELTDYSGAGFAEDLADPMMLSLFGQLGAGVTARLDNIHLGGKFNYRFYNDVPPMTAFEVYPLKTFQFALFAGLSF
jgi:hypothetical protein